MESLARTANRGSVSTGYDIDNSCKFEADNSEYLNRTPAANGSRTTWTTSVWVKRTEIGVDQAVFSSVNNASHTNFYRFLSSDKIRFYFQPDNVAATYYADTNAVFRDTSAWYHIVWGLDSTNSDGSKRFVVYVNGVYQEAAWAGSATASTNCPQNSGSRFLQSEPIQIGKGTYGADHYFNGYMAELHVLDGIAPDPTDFGEFDEDSGIWKPKKYTGSHGTQGFYLDFADASDLGDDESGNGNDFTENNLTSADQSTDTPTNNFCTWSPLWVYATNRTISEGGTKLTGSSAWGGCKGSIGVTNGKWYWEHKASGNDTIVGWQTDGDGDISTGNAHNVLDTIALYQDGNYIWIKDSTSGRNDTSASGSNASGQIIGFALDLDSSPQTATFYRNGSAIASDVNIDGLTGKTLFPFISQYNQNTEANFGGYTSFTISSAASDANGYGTFEYAPPTGYYALCTKNLAEYG